MTKGIYVNITEDGIWSINLNGKDCQIIALGIERMESKQSVYTAFPSLLF